MEKYTQESNVFCIDFVQIIMDTSMIQKYGHELSYFFFSSSFFFLFELLSILVEEIKICPDVACWLLIELEFWLYAYFLMVLQMKLTGFNFTEQKKQT